MWEGHRARGTGETHAGAGPARGGGGSRGSSGCMVRVLAKSGAAHAVGRRGCQKCVRACVRSLPQPCRHASASCRPSNSADPTTKCATPAQPAAHPAAAGAHLSSSALLWARDSFLASMDVTPPSLFLKLTVRRRCRRSCWSGWVGARAAAASGRSVGRGAVWELAGGDQQNAL